MERASREQRVYDGLEKFIIYYQLDGFVDGRSHCDLYCVLVLVLIKMTETMSALEFCLFFFSFEQTRFLKNFQQRWNVCKRS